MSRPVTSGARWADAMTDYIVEDLSEIQLPSSPDVPVVSQPHERAARVRAGIGGVCRPRLAFPQNDGDHPSLTTVIAPFGFGKSNLLKQWAGELAARDVGTLSIVVQPDHVIVEAGPGGRRSPARTGDDFESLPSVVRDWLQSRGRAVVLIDDAHELPDKTVRALCLSFLRADPRRHSLVLASRRPLNVALARARALGRVWSLGASELRFTQGELHELIRRESDAGLHQAALPEVLQTTAGWPAATNLCLLRAREIGVAATLRELKRGSSLMDDLFAEEVLPPLRVALQEFLVGASVLGTLTADVCNAALDVGNSAECLDEVVRAGVFIEAIDGLREEYRLHPLFGQYLESRLMRSSRDQHHAIALRATAWFEQNDRLPEAFDCAVRAEAWDKAASLLERYCTTSYLSGNGKLVTAMALKLPTDALRKYPRAAVFAARGASTDWRFGLVENFLEIAHATAEQVGSSELEDLVLHSRMLKSQYEDDQGEARRICLELLGRADRLDHFTRGTIYGSLLYAHREQFELSDASTLEESGVREFNLSGRPLGLVYHLSVAGPTHALKGDLSAAARRLEQAYQIANGLAEANWIAAVPALLLAEIYYERNDLERSEELLAKHHPAPLVAFIDQYLAAYTTGARLFWRAGDIEGAHRRLDEGMALAESRALGRLRQSILGERIRLLLACAQQDRALEIGRQENLLCGPQDMRPRTHCTTRDEIRAVSWFRLAVARGEPGVATDIGQAWKRHISRVGAARSVMRWEILLSQAYLAQGQSARAHRELRHALDRGLMGGFVRSFLDEGLPIRRLLHEQLGASAIQSSPTDLFVTKLLGLDGAGHPDGGQALDRSPGVTGQIASRPLTRTQTEILEMASAGLQNREIGQRMGMTEGSVKWYLQQIFNKIGIRRRSGALERARSLGLLTSHRGASRAET